MCSEAKGPSLEDSEEEEPLRSPAWVQLTSLFSLIPIKTEGSIRIVYVPLVTTVKLKTTGRALKTKLRAVLEFPLMFLLQ